MPVTIRQKLAPFWFKPNEQDPAGAEFHLRPLTELEFIDVRNGLTADAGRFYLTAAAHRAALRCGLIGWRNVQDDAGAPIQFDINTAEQLPHAVLDLIVNKIASISVLSPEEKKT